MPALSPDGSRVAFVWEAPEREKRGIYTAVVGTQSILRMTANEHDYCPSWSPDGRYLAFLRADEAHLRIMEAPALGGEERTIYSAIAPSAGPDDNNAGLSFSPDGESIAFPLWDNSAQQSSIAALSLNDSRVKTLTRPPAGMLDGRPAVSPDGEKIVFIRSSALGYADELMVVSRSGDGLSALTIDHQRIFGPPSWTPDSREVVFSSNRGGLATLWRVSLAGGDPQRVPGAGPVAWYPSVAVSGSELVYENVDEQENLWRLPLRDPRHASGTASIAVSAAKTCNCIPQFSPDGRKIAFQSGRSGYPEIWISDTDGSHAVQATDVRNLSGTPRWSPDSRYIAFDSRPGQHSEIHVLDTSTGAMIPVAAFPSADNVIPSWSRDGQWIYFASDVTKHFQIWKIAVKNGAAAPGRAVQVTRGGGYTAFESAAGKELFFTRMNQPGMWVTSPNGGVERAVWSGPGPDYWSNWAVSKSGLFFLAPRPGAPPEIEFFDFQTSRPWRIGALAKPSFFGFAVSPDERSLLYSQWDRSERNLLLVKNFR